jgi:serine/threonine-protein kinase
MVGRVFLGRYETIRLLGEGGMGKVFLARHLELDEPVVVKVMHEQIAADKLYRERFRREMRLMARFKHPNAVIIHDASLEDPQGPCIVMEYLPGVSLDRLLAKNVRISPPRLHRLLGQFCDVLQAAHEAGIVHRDLKPANLMVLDPDTPNERLKVMDFGLAQMAERAGPRSTKNTIDTAEYAVGTPGYMAPEQVRGEAVDHRSDLYSVGAIMFELLTGRLPFTGKTVMEVLMAQATDGVPTFASIGVAGRVPPAVEEVVRWALALNPDERPQSAHELFERYETALTGSLRERAAPEPGAAAPGKPVRSRLTQQATSPAPTLASAASVEPAPPALAAPADATVEQIEAFMPEQIATYKLQGFVEEVGGKIVKSAPGLIKVRLKVNPKAVQGTKSGFMSWLGLGPKYGHVEMELRMNKKPHNNVLQITVLLRPEGGGPVPDNPDWLKRCSIITTALKSYLMSHA